MAENSTVVPGDEIKRVWWEIAADASRLGLHGAAIRFGNAAALPAGASMPEERYASLIQVGRTWAVSKWATFPWAVVRCPVCLRDQHVAEASCGCDARRATA